MSEPAFDLEASRRYWQFAPSGLGKVSTEELVRKDDASLFRHWEDHYRSRLTHYWEDRHFVRHFADLFKGKSILSFGSGIGHNEVQFLRGGAAVTCADIVRSNLQVIERVSNREGLSAVRCLFLEDPAAADFGGPYDHIFARGSLMTMPAGAQRRVLAGFQRCLRPGGSIILNLYAWEFVRDTCGVDSPTAFARASDPSVGEIHNPWSDWHDDAKLLALAGEGMRISHKQLWNQGYYVWYALRRRSELPTELSLRPFLDAEALEMSSSAVEKEFAPGSLERLEADFEPLADGSLRVRTGRNRFHYAARTEVEPLDGARRRWYKALVDVDLEEGALSLGFLDPAADRMVRSRAIRWPGRHSHTVHVGSGPEMAGGLPRTYRIVLSNHRENEDASSVFTLHRLCVLSEEWNP